MATIMQELLMRIRGEEHSSYNAALRSAKKELRDYTGEITALSVGASAAFAGIAGGCTLLVKGWLDAASAMQQYRAQLETALKSSIAAQAVLEKAIVLAKQSPFDVQGFVDATVTLTRFGTSAEEWLPRVGNLAAGMAKDIRESSLIVGKYMQGSRMAARQLRDEYGITAQKLKKYGAEMNNMGGVAMQTSEQLDKAVNALRQLIDVEFAGAMERQVNTFKGAVTNFTDAITRFGASLGATLIPGMTKITLAATKVVEAFEKMPAPLRKMAASGTVTIGVVSGLLAGATLLIPALFAWQKALGYVNTQIAANIGVVNGATFAMAENTAALHANRLMLSGTPAIIAKVKASWTALGATMQGVILRSGIYIAAAVAIYTAASLWINKMEEDAKKLAQAVAIEEKGLRAAREVVHDFANATATDLQRAGISVKYLEQSIKDMVANAKQAFSDGDVAKGKWYVDQIRRAKELKAMLQELEKQYGNVRSKLTDLATEYKILGDSDYFKTAVDETTYLKDKIQQAQQQLSSMKQYANQGFVLDFNSSDLDATRDKIIAVSKELAALEKEAGQAGTDDRRVSAIKQEMELLKSFLDLLKGNYDAQNKVRKDDLQVRKDYIAHKKSLNEMDTADEIRAWQRVVASTEKGSKEYIEATRKIEVLRRDLRIETEDAVENSLKKELKAVEDSTSGQVAAYDALIAKIKEYLKAKKIGQQDGNDLLDSAQKGRKKAAEDEQEKTYKKMATSQESYLRDIDRNEEVSVRQRIAYMDSLQRYWETQLRNQVVTKQQAEEQIRDISQRRADYERQLIEANKEAEQELLEARKEAIDYEIEVLKESGNTGEDVQGRIIEKLRERRKITEESISREAAALERQGWTRENIEQQVAAWKAKAYREELADLDSVLAKLREKEEMEKPKPITDIQSLADYQKYLFYGKKSGISSDTSEIESEKERVARQLQGMRPSMKVQDRMAAELPKKSEAAALNIGTITINVNGKAVSGSDKGVTAKESEQGLTIGIPRTMYEYAPDRYPVGRQAK